MKLEQQVCSLELSKKLKELGVKQESLFYWDEHPNNVWEIEYGKMSCPTKNSLGGISAFTASELGEMLPEKKSGRDGGDGCFNYKRDNKWVGVVLSGGAVKNNKDYQFKEDTEADARAKCLIYLLENKLIYDNPTTNFRE